MSDAPTGKKKHKKSSAPSSSSSAASTAAPTAATTTTTTPAKKEAIVSMHESVGVVGAGEHQHHHSKRGRSNTNSRRSGRFTVDFPSGVASPYSAAQEEEPQQQKSAHVDDLLRDSGVSETATAAAGDEDEVAPAKVVRFDKTVDVLVEARKLKKEAKLAKRTKGLTPEKKAQKAKPISERLPQHIGTKITKDHKNFELMFDMLLGIRVSVSLTCGRGPSTARLPASAFQAMRDYVFPSQGSSTTPAHKMRDFKFRDYAPKVFRRLRHLFGVDSSDYLISLTGDYVLSELGSPGKCLARDTPVLLFDGAVKRVQDVKRGDLLMGDDSTPRLVLGTTRGTMPMVRIESHLAPPFECNTAHVLSLTLAAAAADDDSFVVAECAADGVVERLSARSLTCADDAAAARGDAALARRLLRLSDAEALVVCGDVFDIAVEHVLDRARVSAALFARLQTVRAGVLEFAPRAAAEPPVDAYTMGLLLAAGAPSCIPDDYRLASVCVRSRLLAGLLDGSGGDGVRFASPRAGADAVFVARSLGLVAHYDGASGALELRGALSRLPTRRFKAADSDAAQLCEPLRVTALGAGEYFGFAVDGNHRFVLGESFAVTHNSGSFFYYSFDMRFIVKTISHTEATFFRQILSEYYRHVRDNPNTLLPRFFGMHRVKPHKKDVVYLVVMANVFSNNLELEERYDLKGSTLGRRVPPNKKNKDSVLKDLDFLDNKRRIMLGPSKTKLLLDQLRVDADFLARVNSMDYSLLVGVHAINQQRRPQLALIHLPATDGESARELSGSTTLTARRRDTDDDDEDDAAALDIDEALPAGSQAPQTKAERRARARAQKKLLKKERKKNTKRKSLDKKRLKSEKRAAKEAARAVALQAVREGHDVPLAVTPVAAAKKLRPTAKVEQSADHHKRQSLVQSLLRVPGGDDRHSVFVAEDGGFQATNTRDESIGVLYFVGIIDILQPYNIVKWVETRWKSLANPTNTISSIPPEPYAKRFVAFISSITGSSSTDADLMPTMETLGAALSHRSANDDDDDDDDTYSDASTTTTSTDADDDDETTDGGGSIEDTSTAETDDDDDDDDDDSDDDSSSMRSAEDEK